MKILRASGIATAIFSLGLVACGGGPDVAKVKADFDNPSGQTSSKEGLIAATAKQEASGPALGLAAGGVPGASFGLTAEGKTRALEQISIRRNWAPHARHVYDMFRGVKRSSLSTAQFAGASCDAEAQQQFDQQFAESASGSINPSGGSASASASLSQDLAACSDGALSGSRKIELDVEIEFSQSKIEYTYTMEQEFISVCETSGQQACVSGTVVLEATGSQGTDLTGADGIQLQFVTAWDLDATWTDDGAAKAANIKGGVRFGFSGTEEAGNAAAEFLYYVTTPDGEEWSYVMKITADAQGNGTLEIKGSDGSVSCTVSADGSGMCTGDSGELSWAASDAESLDGAWLE